MGKRRNTAKTGDKGLYKSRASLNDDAPKNEDDEDPMYDEVDRFHNEKDKDFLKLDNDGEDSADDDDTVEEAVMDLGVGGDNSSSEDADSSDEGSVQDDGSEAGDGEAALSSSDDDDNDDEELEENVRDWGRKKSAYYHGDTADLEIGQDEDDAFLEEEAAKEVQAARFKDMTEEDFVLSDDEEDAVELRDGKGVTATRNLSKLSMKDKQKLLDKQHPELLPLLSHFSTMVEHLDAKTAVATRAVFFGEEDTADVSLDLYSYIIFDAHP
jgi:U3 small nucleolar RNA-associated protein 3